MIAKSKFSLIILILSVLVLYAGLALAKQDPELKQCRHQCRVQQQYDEEEKEECAMKCEDYHREKKERESEEKGGKTSQILKECQSQCVRLPGEERQLCLLRCQEKWRREQERQGEEEDKKEKEEEHEKHNPYVFEDKHFSTEVKTEQGRVDLLTKFTEKSKLLRGLENYRLALLVANPNAFVVPNHFDADAVFVVTQGRGTITLIHEDKRESFNIERGDIIRVPAGTPIYLINRDDNEKLYIVKFLQPVNLPDHYETSRDKLENLFEKQNQGPFLKASKEQIKALSSHEEGGGGGGIWPFPFGGDSKGAFNLFKRRRPSQSNKYGQLFEVDADEFKPLKDLDLRVSYANITKGCMSALYYNSRATKIAIVVNGEGYFEMACPHVSSKSTTYQQSQDSRSSGRKKSGPSYQKISSRLRPDTVFIVPAGHPFVTVASRNKNLEILCFEVNIQNNIRYPLAGKGNVVEQLEKEAKELAFKSKEEEVDKIFGNQDEEFFFPGPRQQIRGRGRAYE
ncbi:hypothetical protein REPUB_Repub17cG0091200 [Reevesia pubescens]